MADDQKDVGAQLAEKDMLLSLAKDIARIKAKDELMHLIKVKFNSLFYFYHSTIVALNGDGTSYRAFLLDPASKIREHPRYHQLISTDWPVKDGFVDVALEAGGPVVFDLDELEEVGALPPHIRIIHQSGIRKMLNMGLVYDGAPVGMLVFYADRTDAFDESIFPLVNAVGGLVSLAVVNLQWMESIQEDMHRRERENAILLDFSNALSAVRDKADLSAVIHRSLKELFYYDDFIICSIDMERGVHQAYVYGFEEQYSNHPDHHAIVTAAYPLVDGFFETVMASEGAVLIDIEPLVLAGTAPRYIAYDYERGIRTIIALPLREGSRDIGTFQILLKNTAYQQRSLKFLRGLSYQLSIAMANTMAGEKIARQLTEISRYKEQLEEEKMYLQEAAAVGATYEDIIGSGPRMQQVFELLSQVSFANSTVLILGETGTGKELIARAIHNSSQRKDSLMVKVNCAALPANLIESELFGHEKGSFTGATERRIGKFELAGNGTLFLDEIGEMPLDLQVKLLRALQEKEIERLGGRGPIKVNARIITATNRDLQLEVNEGRFRRDLYYRLNVFPIHMPPLRDRKEDIPMLVQAFVEKFSKNAGKKIAHVSGKAMKELLAYDWPGNVRELEHLVERSVLLTKGSAIREVFLPASNRNEITNTLEDTHIKTLEQNERDHILRALRKCNGKVYGPGGAAELLGLNSSTLNSKIRKLGIVMGKTFYRRKD